MPNVRAAGGTAVTEPKVTLATPTDLAEAEPVMREILAHDLGGYRRRWHADIDDLARSYLRTPGCALLVARAADGEGARTAGDVLGTAAVRPCRLASPPNPAWIVREYNRPEVCQLVRVWVSRTARRRGAGRALVEKAVAWSVGPGGYSRVYLHTDAGVPGAEDFWRSLPVREVLDCRPDPFNCVHFEIDVPVVLRATRC